MLIALGHTVPAQCLGGKVPEGHGAIAGPCQQERGVWSQCADSERTAGRVLQRRRHLTCLRAPRDDRAVRGAAEQEAAAGAEAAAVDPVTVTGERRKRQLREVSGVVDAEGFVTRAGRQERRREGAPADLVRVMPESVNYRHHFVSGVRRLDGGSSSLTRWRKMLKYKAKRRRRVAEEST